jgi:hypothetical protein
VLDVVVVPVEKDDVQPTKTKTNHMAKANHFWYLQVPNRVIKEAEANGLY